jgi:hypothetical protein
MAAQAAHIFNAGSKPPSDWRADIVGSAGRRIETLLGINRRGALIFTDQAALKRSDEIAHFAAETVTMNHDWGCIS